MRNSELDGVWQDFSNGNIDAVARTLGTSNNQALRMGKARYVARLPISVKVESASGVARARLARGRSGDYSPCP
jgi:hypothetical protein